MWLAPAGPVVLAGLLLLLGTLFPTDRKKIERLLGDAADQVRAGQWDNLGRLMTDDFQWLIGGQRVTANRQQTLYVARAAASPLNLKAVRLNEPQLTIDGPAATVTVLVTMVGEPSGKPGRGETSWRFVLARQGDGRWLMRSADLLALDSQPVTDSLLQSLVGGM